MSAGACTSSEEKKYYHPRLKANILATLPVTYLILNVSQTIGSMTKVTMLIDLNTQNNNRKNISTSDVNLTPSKSNNISKNQHEKTQNIPPGVPFPKQDCMKKKP